MSASFIIKYAGTPIRFTRSFAETVTEEKATQFTSEAEGWRATRENNLTFAHCEVVPLNQTTKP